MEDYSIRKLSLTTINAHFAVCQLDPNSNIPEWATRGEYYSITRTPDELTIICQREHVPLNVVCTMDWRGIKIEGTFEFNETGILASIANPLGQAGISILVVSTYNTDYVLIQDGKFERGLSVLSSIGHKINNSG